MGAALDYRLLAGAPVLQSETQTTDTKPIRMAMLGSAALHVLALLCLPPLAAWQPQSESQSPVVLQVSVAAAHSRVASSAPVILPQNKKPLPASNQATQPSVVPLPVKPVNRVLAAVNGSAEVAVVSSVPAEVKTTPAPATQPEVAPAAARSGNAEVVEEAAPARVDPGYRSLFKPAYPLSARRRGIEGTVVLRVEVLTSGEPGRVEVARSSGDDALDDSAREAVRQLRFNPAQKGGKAIVGWANVPYQFKLES